MKFAGNAKSYERKAQVHDQHGDPAVERLFDSFASANWASGNIGNLHGPNELTP